jgi:hypothetical protein
MSDSLGRVERADQEKSMARQSSWGWSLAAGVLLWASAVVNIWRAVAREGDDWAWVPGVAFVVAGTLFLWNAFKTRDRTGA